jgi:hypothetical protein
VKIIEELPIIMSLPRISKEYIAKMKRIVQTSTNKKDVHRYTKWILCMTYLSPVVSLFVNCDKRVKDFITRCDDVRAEGKIAKSLHTVNTSVPQKI